MSGAAPMGHLSSRLRIKHLIMLVELGETGRVSHAAERLNMTQPAASRLLREAEDAFGMPLFERSRRGVAPTDAGDVMIRRARILLQDLTAAREELEALGDHTIGRVTVGAFPVATPVLLPLTVMDLRQRHPNLLVSVQEGTNTWLLPALEKGDFDCVIGRMTEAIPDTLEWQTLYFELVCVVCGPQHELLGNAEVSFETLSAYDWLIPHRAHPFRQRLEAQFTVAGLPRPRVILESESLIANASLLRQTDSLALMPLTAAEYLASRGTIGILPIRFGVSDAPVGVFLRAGVETTPPLAGFLDALKSVAGRLDGTVNPENFED